MGDKNHRVSPVFSPFWGSMASLCLLVIAQAALANPTGGTVTNGQAQISASGATTTITQASNTAIINWKDFSINAGQTTQFIQPSSSAVTLNRVTGPNISQINGNLTANGKIYLLNPNGIIFGPSANVNVGSLMATTSQITDSDFLGGKFNFTPSPNLKASIINQGSITIKNAGYAVLVAPNVINEGVITANLGRVAIGAADHFTLDLYGDNLICFDAGLANSDLKLTNSGKISADGGVVLLTTQGVANTVKSVVNLSGYIQAQSIQSHNGTIKLLGGTGSTIKLSGKLDVSRQDSSHAIGLVQATADYVQLLDQSFINANDGQVNIDANYVYGAKDSLITAQGGKVIVWGRTANWFYGNIDAADGFIETSGAYLDVSGIRIKANTWLLDPTNFNITNTSPTTGSFPVANPSTYVTNGVASPSNIYYLDLQNILAAGTSVILDTSTVNTGADLGDVVFSNTTSISWAGSASLTVRANRNITFSTDNTLNNTGTGSITLRADSQGTGTGTVSFGANKINSNGSVYIYYNPTAYTTPTTYNINNGSGSVTAYMLVNTASNLNTIAATPSTWASTFALGNNIDMSLTANFAMIGRLASGSFTGVFNGSNYKISNLKINRGSTDRVGLFGDTNGATLQNIELVDPTITGRNQVGAIVGNANNTTFLGSFTVSTSNGVTPAITGGTDVGGLIGKLTGASTISSNVQLKTLASPDTLTSPLVTGSLNVAGLIGNIASTTVYNASLEFINNAQVTSTAFIYTIGGLFGTAGSNLVFNNPLTNHGYIHDTNAYAIGGIMGFASALTFNGDLTNTGDILGLPTPVSNIISSAGGLFGNINNSTLSGDLLGINSNVTGSDCVGGLIGFSGSNMTYTNTTTFSLIADGKNIQMTGITNNSLPSNPSGPASMGIGGLVGVLDPLGLTFLPTSMTNTLENGGTITVYNATPNSGTHNQTGVGGLIGAIKRYYSMASINVVEFSVGDLTNYATVSSNVTNPTYLGGTIGSAIYQPHTLIEKLNFYGQITNYGQVLADNLGGSGGLFGEAFFMHFTSTSSLINYAEVQSANGVSIGNIAGYLVGSTIDGTVMNYNLTTMSGSDSIGGLIGTSVSNIYNTPLTYSGDISADGFSGGIVGDSQNDIYNAPLSYTGGNVSCTSGYCGGLIGDLYDHSVINSTLTSNADSVTGTTYIGGLIGYTEITQFNGSILSTVKLVSGTSYVGGIIGYSGIEVEYSPGSSLSYTSSTTSTVTGTGDYVGGLIGQVDARNNSFSPDSMSTSVTGAGSITVTGNNYVGGLIGRFNNNGAMISFNPGDITNYANVVGVNQVGGVIGGQYSPDFNFSPVLANITPRMLSWSSVTGTNNVGALFGEFAAGSLTHAGQPDAPSNTVTGVTNVGGVVGYLSGGTLNLVFNNSNHTIVGQNNVGGVVGYAVPGTVMNDIWFGGTIDSPTATNVGGLVGLNEGTVNRGIGIGDFTAATLSGGTNVGALIGDNTAGTMTYSFYDTLLSTTPVGTGPSDGSIPGQGYVASLGLLSTYTDQTWDAALWRVVYRFYSSEIWCSTLCMKPLLIQPRNVSPRVVNPLVTFYTTIQSQTAYSINNEDPVFGYAFYIDTGLLNSALFIIPGWRFLAMMNMKPLEQKGVANHVNWFMNNTYVLRYLGGVSSKEFYPYYELDALRSVVNVLKKTHSGQRQL